MAKKSRRSIELSFQRRIRKQEALGARSKLDLAKALVRASKLDAARKRFEQIVKDYPNTAAAKSAAQQLKELK